MHTRTRWLDQRGITWILPRAGLDAWTGPDPEATAELLRRDAHRLVSIPDDAIPASLGGEYEGFATLAPEASVGVRAFAGPGC